MSSNALVVHGGSIMPALTVQQASERYNVLVEYTKTVMVRDQDYGTIPGVAKPCLYKAGAEKLSSLFGLAPAFELIEKREDWVGKETNGEPLFYYFYKCKLYRGGELVGEADGSCNSWEKKYRYRDGKRKCPKCGGEFIITGKAEYGGGFLCFAKKGGCGAKFKDGDESITKQSITAVPNPDIPEVINTVQKMAQKRALVAAVLIACNASAFYTQDVEDMRTIDVDYEPFEGSKENQQEYLRSKGIAVPEPGAARFQPDSLAAQEYLRSKGTEPPSRSPSGGRPGNDASQQHRAGVIRELDDMLNEPPATPKTIEMRSAAKVAEADAKLKDVAKPAKRKRGGISFEALDNIGQIKLLLRESTKTDEAYYQCLGAYGYKHADEIESTQEARNIYKALGSLNKQAIEQAILRIELEHAEATYGKQNFFATLGHNGCETIDDVLNLSSEPLEALRKDLKALGGAA